MDDLGLELLPGHRGARQSRADEIVPPWPEVHPLYLPPPCHPPADSTDEARVQFLLRTYSTGRLVYYRRPCGSPKRGSSDPGKVLVFANLLRAADVPPAVFVLESFRKHARGYGPPCEVPPLTWVYSERRRPDIAWVAGNVAEFHSQVRLHPAHRALIARWAHARRVVDESPLGTPLSVLVERARAVLGNWDAEVARVRGISAVSARNVRAGLLSGEWIWPGVTL